MMNMASLQSECVTVLLLFLLFLAVTPFKCNAQSRIPPHDEVEAFKEIAKQLNKYDDRHFDDPCNLPTYSYIPFTEYYTNEVICDCSSSANNKCHIKSLNFSGQNLNGKLPSSLWKLPYLKAVNLNRNFLSGSIPPEWASTKLESLVISVNNLSGPIPAELGNITTLRVLNMESNLFSETIPAELGKLVNLEYLNLNANNLTGQFPLSLTNLSKLHTLRISSNYFTGRMPEFGNWKQLYRLEMEASGFSGPIPPSISTLANLFELSITDLNGENSSDFPDLSKMTNLSKLTMRSCNLRGNIHEHILNLGMLDVLDLSFNKLEGPLPNFQILPLRYIYLTSNLLSGPIPAWMNKFGDAMNIDISYNNFLEISEPSTCQDHLMLSKCLAPCSKDYYSLHINCGGKETTIGGIKYEGDEEFVGAANLFHNSAYTWGFSNTGHFRNTDQEVPEYIAHNVSRLRTNNSELYTTARISPLSLTYFARCLINGSYTVKLHFAEIVFKNDEYYESVESVGRRVFDVYVQGKRVLPDFNIKEEAKGVDREFIKVINTVVVSHNTLEIRLQWMGKGTRNVPKQGNYGSLISAISIESVYSVSSHSREGHLSKTKIMIGLVVAVSAGATLLAVVAFGLHRRKAKRKRTATNNDLIWTSTNLKRGDDQPELHFFDLDSILMATNKFSITNKLGQGGFGPVYKGQLHGKEVAVKRLSSSSSQGYEEFRNEIILISKLQHRNLVKLIGCCIENEEKLLIYEFMLNKSLDTFIFDDRRRVELDWAIRFNIIDGIARGLVYLHRDSSLRVIHRDLKASNILLDEKMTPKISDFGLARIFEGTLDLANTHRVVGTIGYMSPEYALRGIFSEKSDVFSYGVLLLEIISGKKNTSFKDEDQYQGLIAYSWQLWSEGRGIELVDEALGESYNELEALKCIHIGLLCVQDFATDRPSMAQVASMLSNQIFHQSQPKQPVFTFKASSSSYDPSTQSGSRRSVNEATVSMVEPR
ncbi:probable LRR receptor-like serine/threonine-protein kinase At1g07650 isoform X3 [Humulus lupulus]|uniref:probable LRR receptor-like serine/threonine-protein kinase At1g07650 isoform X3 n=1 Tax=Humulus lupulus TaxID=3486 RepID=UPI002B400D7A|nr:probable LRR receptor-like serine/threonine-protein kinase At1g07650 isoform X3 [Humulus lupulus]